MTPREENLAHARAALRTLEDLDQQAELERARREGELVARDPKPDNVIPLRPARRPHDREAFRRQYWACARAIYPNGVPPGFELCRRFSAEWGP